MFYNEPLFFKKNRVYRVYTGGKMFSDFFGDDSVDCNFPEEWIASSVKALNYETDIENEGISVIESNGMLFTDALRDYKNELLGQKNDIGILVKYIDSAVRLPVQAHPDKEFSRKHFNSSHGKEESWIILGTRPGAKVYYGFRQGITKEDFIRCIKKSEEGDGGFEEILNSVDVVPGDVFYIPAKFVHAIGAGCLLLEIQEPTDFTIQPERYCADHRLRDEEMYLGVDPDTALDCFDFDKTVNAPLIPEILREETGLIYKSLIGPDITKTFNVRMINLSGGEFIPDKPAAIYVVAGGEGCITGEGYNHALRKSDYFFIPANAVNKFKIIGNLDVVECYE